tara:strand:+ start:9122 stop:9925 length:804 start_codon:yes stop_codon:yes gene_type:complete
MVNLLEKSKLHQTFRQARKIRRHRRKLIGEGVEQCVVVSAYPKSGNTWVARMVSDAIRCEMVAYLSDVQERLPRESGLDPAELRDDVVVARSHHTATLLTLGGVQPQDIAFVVRDPRDISVSGSGFLFASDNVPNEERIDQMIDQMVETQKPNVRWQDVRWDSFVQSAIRKNVLTIRYVDLVNDTAGVLKQILARLGHERSDELIDEVVRFHSFNTSKERAAASGRDDVHQYLRRGEPGAYRNYLNARQRERIESEFRQTMEYFDFL